VEARLGLPCVLKQPDSAFSRGVVKAETRQELQSALERLLSGSDLIVAQGFVPTAFDWRVGILAGVPLYVCRYHMAEAHWQIVRHGPEGKKDEGNTDTLPVEAAPPALLRTAVAAARVIGDGLYGVDIKQVGNRFMVIEVNDNPSIDGGIEDEVLGEALYDRIMAEFARRVATRKAASGQGEGSDRG
ncbi:MAG: RimK family alpha-L-glutamate ligase, partial [Algiphilus sp.]|nr:RimK family alpha-L-glutamate ligase [Algiphilus sp.]